MYSRKIPHKIETLEVGDYRSEKGKAIIEAKRPEDIWGRVINKNNGWDDQMQRLSTYCYDRGIMPWLVVEGTMDDSIRRTRGKVHVNEVRGAIVSATVRYGIAVWHCEGSCNI
jgi:ERCC4-type nuclease